MRKVMMATMLLLLILQTNYAYARTHPPIPNESIDAEKIAIVLLDDARNEQEIRRLVKAFPHVELRHIYKYALNGFSVKGKAADIEKLQRQAGVSHVSPVHTYKVHTEESIKLIGGEDVRGFFDSHNQRLTGKGVTVGVIDTGIDYHHPDLKGNYGGGYDFVDQDDDPMETQQDPELNTLHGTHVAGIIAANGKMKGVAPEATILAYRALGPGGSGTTEGVISAIDRAIHDRVDILNLSLGNNINGPDLPISLALNKAVEHGITAVTSSGNSGPNNWTVGSPGTAAKAISVGASTPKMNVPYLKIAGERIRLEPLQGSVGWDLTKSYELIFAGRGKMDELQDVKGKIALVERGELTFTEKANNASKAGAIGLIIYNNTKGDLFGNLETAVSIPVSSLAKKAGEKLKKSLQEEKMFVATEFVEEQDLLANFSSRGPVTTTWEIKPDIVAPGVAITSTVPGGYLSLQGTSMAAPHIAGAAALIKQAHPDWGPEKIKAAIMNTAKPIMNRGGRMYRTFEQGAGRIQIEKALKTETLVMPASLQFGKFQLAERMHEHKSYVTVENIGRKEQKYSFSIPAAENGLSWRLPLSFYLKPGEKRRIPITLAVDPKEFTKKVYDGALELEGGGKTVQIPYLYVLEEPDYPRVMGFGLGRGDKADTLRYEVYLPGGADEFGIALFDEDTLHFIDYLDWKRNVGRGMYTEEILQVDVLKPGRYRIKVFAKKAGKEDIVESQLILQPDGQIYMEEEINSSL